MTNEILAMFTLLAIVGGIAYLLIGMIRFESRVRENMEKLQEEMLGETVGGQILTPEFEYCLKEYVRRTCGPPKEERRLAVGKTAAAEGRTDLDPKAWGRYYQLRRQMTNNYRKMHGMPMIRRLKRRRTKRT